jgi:hypothetical protein
VLDRSPTPTASHSKRGSGFLTDKESAICLSVFRILATQGKRDFVHWRRSTMHQEIVTLRQVLKTAVLHGWMPFVPILSSSYKTNGKIVHRAWFSPEEYKQLYTASRLAARNKSSRQQREGADAR